MDPKKQASINFEFGVRLEVFAALIMSERTNLYHFAPISPTGQDKRAQVPAGGRDLGGVEMYTVDSATPEAKHLLLIQSTH